MAKRKPSSKVEKTITSFESHEELKAAERAHWHSRTPLERLAATEMLRQLIYGYDPLTARVERKMTIIDLKDS